MTSLSIAPLRRVMALLLAAAFAVTLSSGMTAAYADTTPSDDHVPGILGCCSWPPK